MAYEDDSEYMYEMGMNREDRNYYMDSRVRAKPMKLWPGCEKKVCDLCNGEGRVVNPSIDCCGLTREDFDEDPDFADDYRNGVYDIRCPQCEGRRVIPVGEPPLEIEEPEEY